jgi:uncharacterized membrane protein YbhN (UPF0104 family)
MAVFTPRLFRRGLEIFAAISLVGLAGLLLYGNNLERFVQAILGLQFWWLVLGVGIASLDWFGGGLRLFVVARHVYPQQSLGGASMAGGLNTWASYLTPSQTGGGPMMIYVLKRYGTPLPEATVARLKTFVATVIFFAIAGPTAVFLGAGRSLTEHGVIGDAFDLFDLFKLSLGGFLAVGLGLVVLIAFPGIARRLAGVLRRVVARRGRAELADRIAAAEAGVDRAHRLRRLACLGAARDLACGPRLPRTPTSWWRLRGPENAGDPRTSGRRPCRPRSRSFRPPTPGGSGLAELISAVMSVYVPRELTPSYILLWRVLVCYLTVGFGSVVFWRWLKDAERRGEGLDAVTVGG